METEKARDKRPPLNKPSNPTSKANLRRSQKADNTACRATLQRKQASTPTNKVNSSKKAVPQQLKQLFKESSTPTIKTTLRRKKKAPPEDTAFVNN